MNLGNVAHIDVTVDDETLARAARDEWAAFEILYRRYVTPVYRYCYTHTDDAPATQEEAAGQQLQPTWLFYGQSPDGTLQFVLRAPAAATEVAP